MTLRRGLYSIAICLIVFGAAILAIDLIPLPTKANKTYPEGNVQRGAYLARISGCISCHTNLAKGGRPLAGDKIFKTQFGQFISPNITTDKTNGIGNWSIDDFSHAVRNGISPAGQSYYPTFPYPFFNSFSDQDIADLWAAFRTVPAVNQSSQDHELMFPFGYRPILNLWRLFNLQPEKNVANARGEFLVTGPLHCGACHTPRNYLGGRRTTQRLKGNDTLPGGKKAPSIVGKDLLKKGWDKKDLIYALRFGLTPKGDSFEGKMGEYVRDVTAYLSGDDLEAVARYIFDQPHH